MWMCEIAFVVCILVLFVALGALCGALIELGKDPD
jgi:hypothetical protein